MKKVYTTDVYTVKPGFYAVIFHEEPRHHFLHRATSVLLIIEILINWYLLEEDTRAKDNDIDQNQDRTYTEKNPVRFFREMEQEQILFAFIAGGETVVMLTGHGLGGRNQEIALAAAPGISGMSGAAVFSVGSDGTDGPTDAAGGYVDGDTCRELAGYGLTVDTILHDNDAYHALEKISGLIITGPTGTNVNDVAVALLRNT